MSVEGEYYACGGPRRECTVMVSFRYSETSYAVHISENNRNGESMQNESDTYSDWNCESMSITAYWESSCSWSAEPPKCEWTIDDPFMIWACENRLIPQ